jgi:hypothetical protein
VFVKGHLGGCHEHEFRHLFGVAMVTILGDSPEWLSSEFKCPVSSICMFKNKKSQRH